CKRPASDPPFFVAGGIVSYNHDLPPNIHPLAQYGMSLHTVKSSKNHYKTQSFCTKRQIALAHCLLSFTQATDCRFHRECYPIVPLNIPGLIKSVPHPDIGYVHNDRNGCVLLIGISLFQTTRQM